MAGVFCCLKCLEQRTFEEVQRSLGGGKVALDLRLLIGRQFRVWF